LIPSAIGFLIILAMAFVFVANRRKNEQLQKIAVAFTLLIIAGLFIFCQAQFPVQRTAFDKQREMTAVALFFAVMLALVLHH